MINIDARIKDADWPKRTDDRIASLKALKARSETPLHAAADAQQKQLSVAVRFAFTAGRKSINVKKLESAKDLRSALDTVSHVPVIVQKALMDVLPKALRKAVEAGTKVGSDVVQRKSLRLRTAAEPWVFNPNPAIDWANRHALELAKGLSETTREDLREAISKAFTEAIVDPAEAYKALVEEVLDAVGSTERALLIAETEVMYAAHEGQREVWRQAQSAGLISRDAKRMWLSMPNCCSECEALDGEVCALDGYYEGDISGPPRHPRCRCTERIE